MNISPISFYNLSHKSNYRMVKDKNGNLLYRTTTYLFRDDFDWFDFTKLVKRKYKNVDKVNFIIHACSNGSEVYSSIISLINGLGAEAKKFFPIIGKDIDSLNIKNAKSGSAIGIKDMELQRIHSHTKYKTGTYFTYAPPSQNKYDISLKPNQVLRDKVKFSQGNILDDLDDIPKENTILFCRNFWPYLDKDKREAIADKIAKLDKSSLVAIGSFDKDNSEVVKLLQNKGFEPTIALNVYEKK